MKKEQRKITVALSVWRPDERWLSEQIASIAVQDIVRKEVGAVELLCWNDSPDDFDAASWFRAHPQPFPVRVLGDSRTRGVTAAFAALTEAAGGTYIAYCDQDDLWHPQKLSRMAAYLDAHPACPCCHCDAEMVDGDGNPFGRRLYPEAPVVLDGLAHQKQFLLRANWTLGCAMLVRTAVAKAALPFPFMVYHDQWLAVWSAFHGGITFLPDVLLQHRLHSRHASQMLAGIENRADYYRKKLVKDSSFLAFVCKRIPEAAAFYADDRRWMEARTAWQAHRGFREARALWSGRHVRLGITCFELLLPFLPDAVLPQLLAFLRQRT